VKCSNEHWWNSGLWAMIKVQRKSLLHVTDMKTDHQRRNDGPCAGPNSETSRLAVCWSVNCETTTGTMNDSVASRMLANGKFVPRILQLMLLRPSGYYWFIFLTSAPTIRVVYLSYLLRPSTTFSCNYTAAVAPLCWNETESRFSKLPKMILAKKQENDRTYEDLRIKLR